MHCCLVACSLRGPSSVTQILLFLPTALFLWLPVTTAYSILELPCVLLFLPPKAFRGGRMALFKGKACRRGWTTSYCLTRKVRTQTEGTECEISTLLSAPQPGGRSCFHCAEAGRFPKVDPGKVWEGARGLQPCPSGTLPALSLPSTRWGGNLSVSPSCRTTLHIYPIPQAREGVVFLTSVKQMQISWLCCKSHHRGSRLGSHSWLDLTMSLC